MTANGTRWESLDVCVDCVMAIEGYETVDTSNGATARRLAFLSAHHVVNGVAADSWFSHSSCDVCDSGFGGMRSEAFYVVPNEA